MLQDITSPPPLSLSRLRTASLGSSMIYTAEQNKNTKVTTSCLLNLYGREPCFTYTFLRLIPGLLERKMYFRSFLIILSSICTNPVNCSSNSYYSIDILHLQEIIKKKKQSYAGNFSASGDRYGLRGCYLSNNELSTRLSNRSCKRWRLQSTKATIQYLCLPGRRILRRAWRLLDAVQL